MLPGDLFVHLLRTSVRGFSALEAHLADRIAEKPAISLRALKAATVAPRRELFERARVSEIAMHELTFARADTRHRLRDDYGVA